MIIVMDSSKHLAAWHGAGEKKKTHRKSNQTNERTKKNQRNDVERNEQTVVGVPPTFLGWREYRLANYTSWAVWARSLCTYLHTLRRAVTHSSPYNVQHTTWSELACITGSSFTFQLLLYRRRLMVAATGVVIAICAMVVVNVYYTQHKGAVEEKRKENKSMHRIKYESRT